MIAKTDTSCYAWGASQSVIGGEKIAHSNGFEFLYKKTVNMKGSYYASWRSFAVVITSQKLPLIARMEISLWMFPVNKIWMLPSTGKRKERGC